MKYLDKKIKWPNIIIFIMSLIILVVVAKFVLYLFAALATMPLLSGLFFSFIPFSLSFFAINIFFQTGLMLINTIKSAKKLNVINRNYKLKNYNKEKYKCKELEETDDKNLNPYFLVALWYIDYCQKNKFGYNDSVDITYKTIMEMQRSGYGNSEITEKLMMDMAQHNDEEKEHEQIKSERQEELRLVRNKF